MATRAIDPKFGVSKHFISSASGVGKEGDETKETFIQDSYAQNLAKVEMLDMRLIMYDTKAIFMISTLIDGINITTVNNIANTWNDDDIGMLYHWEKITFAVACYWQLTINRRVPIDSPDRETNDWIYLLLINLYTPRLCEQINTKYKALDHCF